MQRAARTAEPPTSPPPKSSLQQPPRCWPGQGVPPHRDPQLKPRSVPAAGRQGMCRHGGAVPEAARGQPQAAPQPQAGTTVAKTRPRSRRATSLGQDVPSSRGHAPRADPPLSLLLPWGAETATGPQTVTAPSWGAAPPGSTGTALPGGDTAFPVGPASRALPGRAGGVCGVEAGAGRAAAAALRTTAPCAGSRRRSGSVHSPGGGKGSQGLPVSPPRHSQPPNTPWQRGDTQGIPGKALNKAPPGSAHQVPELDGGDLRLQDGPQAPEEVGGQSEPGGEQPSAPTARRRERDEEGFGDAALSVQQGSGDVPPGKPPRPQGPLRRVPHRLISVSISSSMRACSSCVVSPRRPKSSER